MRWLTTARRARLLMTLAAGVRRGLVTAAVGAPVVFFLALLVREWYVVWTPVVLMAAGFCTAIARPVALRRAAVALDSAAGTKERFISALDVVETGRRDAMAHLVLADAERLAGVVRPTGAAKVAAASWVTALLWLYMGLPLVLVSAPPGGDRDRPRPAEGKRTVEIVVRARNALPPRLRESETTSDVDGEPRRILVSLRRRAEAIRKETERLREALEQARVEAAIEALNRGAAGAGAGAARAAEHLRGELPRVRLDAEAAKLLAELVTALERTGASEARERFEALKRLINETSKSVGGALAVLKEAEGLSPSPGEGQVSKSDGRPETAAIEAAQESVSPAPDADRYPPEFAPLIRRYFSRGG